MMYACRYYGTGYFIFAQLENERGWEPIIEVEDEIQGQEYIAWLTEKNFIAEQLKQVANDNIAEFH